MACCYTSLRALYVNHIVIESQLYVCFIRGHLLVIAARHIEAT